ncbi:MAG: type VI secretion system ImpA family N-terminal domain-containing protein [Holosporales bacterium]|jgi:type VI secretion system protein ImpA|nr:type VI secretion system ImpA family N-terminal domain-containing protein [Holosporales bacterium]
MTIESYSIDDIIAEIPGTTDGVGSDLSLTSVYDEIKHARFEEDSNLSLGVWERDLKKADWKLVENLTVDSLKNRTKDLQVLAWLIEAIVVLRGFEGILEATELLRSFLESFWASCYPKTNDHESDIEYKYRILDWIYDTVAKRMLYIPFAKLGNAAETTVNLYQYEYALEIQARQVSSPKSAEELGKYAQKNDIKTIDEIHRIVGQISPESIRQFSEISERIQEGIKNLTHTISKISESKAFGIFTKTVTNLSKINGLLIKYAPQENDLIQKEEGDASLLETVTKSPNMERAALYRQLVNIKQQLIETDKHSPSHFLLELVVSWQNKTLLEIINDLKQGETSAHKLLRILMS